MTIRRLALLATLLAFLPLAALAQTEPTLAPLENTHWQLIRLNRQTITPDPQRGPDITLNSENHRVAGAGGCNRIMGGYTLEASKLTFSQMASTMMACPTGMDTEREFLKALDHVQSWKITNNTLRLLDASGKTLATFQPAEKN